MGAGLLLIKVMQYIVVNVLNPSKQINSVVKAVVELDHC